MCFFNCAHDDMLDCVARILDIDLMAVFPKIDGSVMNTLPVNVAKYDVLEPVASASILEYDPLAV